MLHPGTHMFWDNEEIRAAFMEYLAVWSKNPAAYIQKGYCDQDSTTRKEKELSDEETIEVGFVPHTLLLFDSPFSRNSVCRMKRTKRILNSSETFDFVSLGTENVTIVSHFFIEFLRLKQCSTYSAKARSRRKKSENFETLKKIQKL